MDLKKERQLDNGPIHHDESWWAAVLQDVETRLSARFIDSVSDDSEEDIATLIEPEPAGSDTPVRGDSNEIDWELVKDLYEGDEVVQLKVANHNKGGLLVRGDGIQGFVPASHLVELSKKLPLKDRDDALAGYVGDSLQLKVIECDQDQGRIVFSERAAQAEPGKRLELLTTLHEGDRVFGRVTTITDFGVFIDLGGIEGLIHISELSWGRVCHPQKIVNLGDEIDVYILNIDRQRSRVALSLKRLYPNPWESAQDRYYPGKLAKAVITNIVSFGAFARLEDGLDGLIHISELGKNSDDFEIDEIVTEGQEVEVCILHIDAAQQRLGLSLHTTDVDNV